MGIVSADPVFIIEAEVGAPSRLGDTGAGVRRYVPITGGRVSGSIEGVIIPGGDWQTLHADGNLQIEAHYGVRTSSGAVLEVVSSGARTASADVLKRLDAGEAVDPSEYYFRTAIRLRAGAPEFAHLNFRLFVARGERRPNLVRLEVFEVL